MNILLVEPNIPLTYPNLALMKISARHKKKGHQVHYVKGLLPSTSNDMFGDDLYKPDIIYISTLFTYQSARTIECINYYKDNFQDAKILVGGIFATLMPDYIEEKTGIKPFIGFSSNLDKIKPDYSLYEEFIKYSPKIQRWENFSMIFTTRGCPRSCKFCAVKRLEPRTEIIENWKDLIDYDKKHIMVYDNNLTAMPKEHFKEVVNFLAEKRLITCFHNGFDVRLLDDEKIEMLSKIRWQENGLRLAFDNMTEDGYLQDAIKKLRKLGVPKYAFMVFVLFNFQDDFDEAMYRATEVRELGVRPYPQIFKPLNALDNKIFVSEKWTADLAREFRYYWLMAKDFKKKTFSQFLAEKGKRIEDLLPKSCTV
jgi:hypothetical protein